VRLRLYCTLFRHTVLHTLQAHCAAHSTGTLCCTLYRHTVLHTLQAHFIAHSTGTLYCTLYRHTAGTCRSRPPSRGMQARLRHAPTCTCFITSSLHVHAHTRADGGEINTVQGKLSKPAHLNLFAASVPHRSTSLQHHSMGTT